MMYLGNDALMTITTPTSAEGSLIQAAACDIASNCTHSPIICTHLHDLILESEPVARLAPRFVVRRYISTVTDQETIGIEGRYSTQMRVKHFRPLRELATSWISKRVQRLR